GPANRPAQLRRALQSERHVACVYPPDDSPDIAHEASMIRGDTGKLLFPIMPDALHPGVRSFAEELAKLTGKVSMLRFDLQTDTERATGEALCLPGWDVLRRIGGENGEVAGVAASGEVDAEPVVMNGRFAAGLLFQVAVASGG